MTEESKEQDVKPITMRTPFPPNQISLLPKPLITMDEYKKLPKGKCAACGGYHATSQTTHLSYVGHAAVTNRLLDVDPDWSWKPLSTVNGLPALDSEGGLWIELTVNGVTRIGYGNAKPNPFAEIGSTMKEKIGDAIRNAAMRFGCALELWAKGVEFDLEAEEEKPKTRKPKSTPKDTPPSPAQDEFAAAKNSLRCCASIAALSLAWNKLDARTKNNLVAVKEECKTQILALDKLAAQDDKDIPQ